MLVAMRALRDWRPEKPGERELASAEAGCGSLWSRVTALCQPPGADILRCEPRPRSPGHQYSEGAGPDRAGAFYLVSASSVSSRLSFLSLAANNFTTQLSGYECKFCWVSQFSHPGLSAPVWAPAGYWSISPGRSDLVCCWLNTILCSVSR